MVELDQGQVESTGPQSTLHNHRQLLRNIDLPPDQQSDNDGTTDDELEPAGLIIDGDEAGSLLGVSISQAQTHMKSPYTPAFEKSQALKESRDYFGIEPSTETSPSLPPSRDVEHSHRADSPKEIQGLPTPWKSQPERSQRSSISRAIFGDVQDEGRKRASSGSGSMLGNIRKMFADLPSYPGFGSSSRDGHNQASARDGTATDASYSGTRSQRSHSVAQPFFQPKYGTGLDGATTSSEQQATRPKALRRTTSDNSLYLRRAATGASDFDDTTSFSKVVDMPNPRFKAITDSLADSSIRMPKIPSISFSNARSMPVRTNSEVTAANTKLNTGTRPGSSPLAPEKITQQNTPGNEKKHPVFTEALANLTGDVVFMGGYRGSVLRSADFPYQQLWVPVKVGLGIRKVDLEVGLTHEDEEKMEEKIIPSGILAHIGPIDIARRMIKKVRKSANARANQLRIHDWGYDWRLSPHFLSQKLIKFLEDLECNHPETPLEKRGAVVVAHSLGGLITRHAVNQRPELFAGVVYAGTPQNCANILGPLRNGDDVLLSSKVLTAQVNFTLRTSYALLPEDGRCFLNKTTGERYDIDFFNIDSWDEFHLSPCIRPALPPYTQPNKSIVGSITDTISSFTPSLPGKRSSWFFNSTSADEQTANSATDAVKEKAEEAKEDIKSAAEKLGDQLQSPKQEAQGSLEPSMKSTHNKPSVATAVTLPKDKAREYLIRTLAEVKQFKAELRHIHTHEDANRYPPHAIIYGKTVPTVYGAKVPSREAIKCSDCFDDLAFAAGDGVVLASAAQLPPGYRCVKGGRVQSERGHIGLLGDLEGIGQCISAVVEGRKRGIGLGPVI